MNKNNKINKTKLYDGISCSQILQLIPDVKIIRYHDIEQKYNNIDDLLKPYNKCIILYNTTYNYGHFVCLFKNKNNIIHFFDSYGLFPDNQKKFISKKYYLQNYKKIPKLTKLLYECDYEIRYNEYVLQSKSTHTCGRWCIVRLIFNDDDEYEFYNRFKKYKGIDKDIVIIKLTNEI